MRAKMRFSRRVRTIFLMVIVAIVFYTFGFNNGEESVYKKAKNDVELLKMYSPHNK